MVVTTYVDSSKGKITVRTFMNGEYVNIKSEDLSLTLRMDEAIELAAQLTAAIVSEPRQAVQA